MKKILEYLFNYNKLKYDQAKKIGFPICIKSACGGGGKGIRFVYCEEDLFMILYEDLFPQMLHICLIKLK